MISVEKYIELREKPVNKEFHEFLEKTNIEFAEGDWLDFKGNYSTFGEFFDKYKRDIHSYTCDIVKALNKMIISYLNIHSWEISRVARKILPQGQEVKYTLPPKKKTIHDFFLDTRKDLATIIKEEVVDNLADPMLDPNLILVIQQIIDDMEEERKALEASAVGQTI